MDLSLPYIAGFFDGEGSIGVYGRLTRGVGVSFRTQLAQNKSILSEKLLESLMKEYGGNLSIQTTLSGKEKFNWQLGASNACRFLEDILPFMILKKEQAQIAVAWFCRRQPIGRESNGRIRPISEEQLQDNIKTIKLLKQLKGK